MHMTTSDIAYCKIYPGIGIARMGNSPQEFFIGPETPGIGPDIGTQFQDKKGNVKRQGARFRVYGFDSAGNVIQEINAAVPGATVNWSVHLANRKASSNKFDGVLRGMELDKAPDATQNRNQTITDRHTLNITPTPRQIGGTNRFGPQYTFNDGEFRGQSVPLGELRTDDMGRLIVLGGYGKSGSVVGARPITHYANNDGWFDDSSDGTIEANVSIAGREIPLRGSSWVIVAPPKYAPYVRNVVSLYDVMAEAGGVPLPITVSFTEHIYPHLKAFGDQQWVNGMALRGHGPQKGGNFLDPAILRLLSDNRPEASDLRQKIMSRLRKPGISSVEQASFNYMPQLSGDEGDVKIGKPDTWLSIPSSVYALFERWAAGDFESDWTGAGTQPIPIDLLPIENQPAALNKAALEMCVGGAFFPGIEITYIARDPTLYVEPFRFDPGKLVPGDVTRRMAVPWQADFHLCSVHWWPAQRPDDVVTEELYRQALDAFPFQVDGRELAKAISVRMKWDRGVGERWLDPERDREFPAEVRRAIPGANAMVDLWHSLGFVTPVHTGAGEEVQIEIGRSRYDGLGDRDYFFYLLNIDSYPDFLPRAKVLAEAFLADARAKMDDPTPGSVDDFFRYFAYTSETLGQRLDEIYTFYQQDAARDPFEKKDLEFKTRNDIVERIRQFAPLNQMDGAWVRNVAKAGPIDEVGALLFSIWMDEVGDGNLEENHANVYTNLLAKVGVQLPPVATRDYANNPDMLDSAYTVPVFQLAISQFTEAYFPEILGMTLQLEWEVLALWPTIKLLRHFNIDSHFYELHVGIDNAANGHGAKARRAVERFLDEARKRGGDEEVQAVWRRIWTGYVAFGTTGTLSYDLKNLLKKRAATPPTPEQKIDEIILAKKPYGNLNHGEKKIGPHYINDMFENPKEFRDALVNAGYIIPGHPEQSSFFRLTTFEGPMYKVFTEDELDEWREWTFWLKSRVTPEPLIDDPTKLMLLCIDHFRDQQRGNPGHSNVNLTGRDPANLSQMLTQPLSAWFSEPTEALLAVLANPDNGYFIPNDSAHSPFVVKVLNSNNAMTKAFDSVAPNTGGKTWREIAVGWIDAGCPLPHKTMRSRQGRSLVPGQVIAAPRLTLTSSQSEIDSHPRGRVQGMGVVH